MSDRASRTEPARPDASRMPALLSYVRQRRCALFVGAGLSRPAGYPGWRGLMESTLEEAVQNAGPDADEARRELGRLLEAGRYAEVADQCRQILGRQRFWNLLRTQLDRPAEPPPSTHGPIVRTPYACIVTTNFDTLLEDAFGRWADNGTPKAPTGIQLGDHGTLLVDGAFFILKAHGTIHDEASLVFTSEDYRRIIHANPAFQSMMAAILLSHALLFVGYSLNDPNFRLLIESQLSIFGTDAPPRYALMEGVGRMEAQILRRTAGIEVIPYPHGRHDEVATFLQTIADATGSPPPSRRRPCRTSRSKPPALPALHLSIRPRNALLEVVWFETTTDDPKGALVPPENRWVANAGSLPWSELAQTPEDIDESVQREMGKRLGTPFAQFGIPFIQKGNPRLVLLDLPPELAALPWEWIDVHGRPLCLQAPVCRTVSGLNDSSRGRPFPHAPLRVLLIGDALGAATTPHRLPGTRQEVEAIRDCFRKHSPRHRVTLLTGALACYERVLHELSSGGYDVVHVAGVAYVDDSGESVLPLHDGHVRASEIATLLIRCPPSLVFLDADFSGFVPAFGGYHPIPQSSGGEFADFYDRLRRHRPGFERVVGRAGVGTFVGCMSAAQDQPARDLAIAFYQQLLTGQSMAHALHQARLSRPKSEERTTVLFAMAGYPEATLVPAPSAPTRRVPRKAKA